MIILGCCVCGVERASWDPRLRATMDGNEKRHIMKFSTQKWLVKNNRQILTAITQKKKKQSQDRLHESAGDQLVLCDATLRLIMFKNKKTKRRLFTFIKKKNI